MGRCRRHPHHAVVGVCAHCLNDRLLALMEEEEDDEVMVHQLYEMSPHTYKPPSSSSSYIQGAGSMSKQARTPATAQRTSMDYNRADVRQLAASYLRKHHHSLTSSPQFHPIKGASPYTKSVRRIRRPAPLVDTRLPFVAEEITRKKKASLWSILLGHKDDNIAKKRHSHGCGDQAAHAWRDNYAGGGLKTHHVGARNDHVSPGAIKHRLDNSWRSVDASMPDRFIYPGKPSFTISTREAHEGLRKGDTSLLSSPHFMASPSRPAHHHFPSPISKYAPPSPLRNERGGDDERASPGKHMHGSHLHSSYGFSGYDVDRDDDTSGTSWISSLFPRRNCRSKSISSSDIAVSYSQPSYVYSVGASPDSAPRGCKKSVSFLNEDMNESPVRRYISPKASQIKGLGAGFKSPDVHARGHAYNHLFGSIEIKSNKNFKSPKSSSHGVFSEHTIGQEHSMGRGRSVNESVVDFFGSSTLKTDTTVAKSPHAKLVSFLNKRKKNGTVSIDCGRDVRVSPVPMLRVKRDDLNHQDLLDEHDHHGRRGHNGLDHLHEAATDEFNEDLQKDFAVEIGPTDKDILKSPRLMSLHGMKQLLKSPKLAPVRTSKRGPDDDDTHPNSQAMRSWSKAFSKTLSPMLNRKHKKKQGKNTHHQDCSGDGYPHTQYSDNDQGRNDESKYNQINPYGQQSQAYHQDHRPSVQNHRLQRQHGNSGSIKGDELLEKETRVLPALDEKGPPQQYSFLSKDYSAFSFYFSPVRLGNMDRATHTPKKGSVW